MILKLSQRVHFSLACVHYFHRVRAQTSLNWKRVNLDELLRRNSLLWEWWGTGTGYPEELCMPQPWRCSTPDCTTWSSWRRLYPRWEGLEQGNPSAPFHLKLIPWWPAWLWHCSGEQHIPEKHSRIVNEELKLCLAALVSAWFIWPCPRLSTDILLLIVIGIYHTHTSLE